MGEDTSAPARICSPASSVWKGELEPVRERQRALRGGVSCQRVRVDDLLFFGVQVGGVVFDDGRKGSLMRLSLLRLVPELELELWVGSMLMCIVTW